MTLHGHHNRSGARRPKWGGDDGGRATVGSVVVLRPTTAQVVRPEWAASVVGPAYDSLRPAERRQLAAANPTSFFNVVRSPADEDADGGGVLDAAADALEGLLASCYGDPTEALFLYRLRSAHHEQATVTADVPTAAVLEGVVRPHERTRTAKEDELTRHLRRLRMNSSPVGLTYRPSARIDAVVARELRRPPMLDFSSIDGVHQTVWALGDGPTGELLDAFTEVSTAYIVDGHHRVAATRRAGAPAFLASLIPTDQLHLLPYHRLVGLVPPVTRDRLVEAVGAVRASPAEAPGRPGTVLLRADQRWWHFELSVEEGRRLDVAALEEDVLVGVLGILDPRTDPRLDVVPGHLDLARLAQLADEGEGVAFALHPPTVAQLMVEADAGRTLPPKSTWFEPKLRSGVFVVRR
ncbi:MAG: DUF1015 family protein [Acidimicrobiia bacterium]|nr:DUF1015 family protein [Acidimicrobiia bacterium]